MRQYEVTFIIDPVLPNEEIDGVAKNYKEQLGQEGCEIVHMDAMGLRQLAYPIHKRTSGIYYCIEFTSPGHDVIEKLELSLRRDERIMRFLTVKLDKYGVKYNADKRAGLIGRSRKEDKKKKDDDDDDSGSSQTRKSSASASTTSTPATKTAPVAPVAPVEPAPPADKTAPVEPAEPTPPVAETPVAPAAPVESPPSAEKTAPVEPAEPTPPAAETPVTPAEPEEPAPPTDKNATSDETASNEEE